MSPVKRMMNFLMLSCKKASSLIEKKLDFKLSVAERFQLYMHTSMCEACRAYEKQSNDMDSILNDHIHTHSDSSKPSEEKLSDDFKTQMINKLKEEE